MTKLILDLCGGTGSWSRPYAEAGYWVQVLDMSNGDDVRLLQKIDEPVHGILAAPPCTHLAVSGAWCWERKGDEALLEAMSVVDACLRIVMVHQPKWWALENPVGRLVHYIGKPRLYFQPYDYGNPWTKKTCIWGDFELPEKSPVDPVGQRTGRADMPGIVDHFDEYLPPDWIMKLGPSKDRATLRSLTPPGFARAFFEANP